MNTDTKPNPMSRFNFTVEIDVAWGDMDAMSHVNNTVYFKYMETARIEFFSQFFDQLAKVGNTTITNGLALAEARCRFKVPLTYPDKVIVGCGVGQVDESQFMVIQEIYSTKMECVAAEGDGRMVSYDYVNICRGVISDELWAQLDSFKL